MNILKNHHIKLLSVFSALVLWLFVVGVENYVSVLPDPLSVKVVNLGQNVSVANDLPYVRVKYKTNNNTAHVNAAEIELFVDAQGLIEGNHAIPVQFTNKNPNLRVVALDPPIVDLKLEAMTTKEIGLKTDIRGEPDEDFEVRDSNLDIERVTISGAASAIDAVETLPITVTLDGTETADFSRKVTLQALAEWEVAGDAISFDPEVVMLDIQIRKKKVAEDDRDNSPEISAVNPSDQPVAEGNVRKNFMVEIVPEDSLRLAVKELLPQNILLTVEGTEEEIASVNSGSIKLLLTSPSVKDGQYVVSTDDLIFPNGIELKIIKLSPDKVSVKF